MRFTISISVAVDEMSIEEMCECVELIRARQQSLQIIRETFPVKPGETVVRYIDRLRHATNYSFNDCHQAYRLKL